LNSTLDLAGSAGQKGEARRRESALNP